MPRTATRFVEPLDDADREVLQYLMDNGETARIRRRAHAILLSNAEKSVNEIPTYFKSIVTRSHHGLTAGRSRAPADWGICHGRERLRNLTNRSNNRQWSFFKSIRIHRSWCCEESKRRRGRRLAVTRFVASHERPTCRGSGCVVPSSPVAMKTTSAMHSGI